MALITARRTRRGSFAGGGLSQGRALICPVNGVRCESTACVGVGWMTENGHVDAERLA